MPLPRAWGAAAASSTVARAVVRAIEADAVSVERIDPDRSSTVIASLDAPRFPIGNRWP